MSKPIFLRFALDYPPDFGIFSESETIQNKLKKNVLIIIFFHIGENNKRRGDFIGEKMTFTLKILKNKRAIELSNS